MRRLALPIMVVASLVLGIPPAMAMSGSDGHDHRGHDHGAPGHAAAAVPHDRPARGLVYEGLRPAVAGGPCDVGNEPTGLFELRHGGRFLGCTHGPDPAPAEVDVRDADAAAVDAAGDSSTSGEVPCIGDGVTGFRTQAIYAYPSSQASRFKTSAPLIRGWAADVVDAPFDNSAAKTGGDRHVRFVTDPGSCRLDIDVVAMPDSAVASLSGTASYLKSLGYTASNRKYLVWMDANVYCGIAELYSDDRDVVGNYNNGPSFIPGMFARVDSPCWGRTGASQAPVEAHELLHTLGGVQHSAPHTTHLGPGTGGHCTDDHDVMCYDDDGSGPIVASLLCTPASAHERLFDCGNDDYFHTSPRLGSYLDGHWNTAESRFLERSDPSPPASAPPGNDAFAGAQGLSGTATSASGTNAWGSRESGEPSHAGARGGSSIWFRWTAPQSGVVQVSTSGSAIDSLLGVYRGSRVDALTTVAANDDRSATDLTSRVSFDAIAGTTYSFAVDGYAGDVGAVRLQLGYPAGSEATTEPTAPTAPTAAEPSRGPVDLSAKRRRVRAGARAVLKAAVPGCDAGDPVRLRRGTKSWTKALDGSCTVSFRVKMKRTSRFSAVDVATGAVSPRVKVRVKR